MRLPWRREARQIEPLLTVTPRLMELETAKEILAEIFHARPTDVDEMIQSRLGERSCAGEQTLEDGLWPATYCLGE